MEKTKSMPSLGLFFSPHCGACTSFHPTWKNATNLFVDNLKVMAFECDTHGLAKICDKFISTRSVPTFVQYVRGNGTKITLNRTVSGVSDVLNKLASFNPEISCDSFSFNFREYPAVVYYSDGSISQACKMIEQVKKVNPKNKDHLYFEINNKSVFKKSEALVSYFDSNNYLEYDGDINLQSISLFLKDFSLKFNSDWPNGLKSGFSNPRRLAFIINNGELNRDLLNTLRSYQKQIIFGKIHLKDYNKCFTSENLTKQDLPALGITSLDKKNFFLFSNLQKNLILESNLKKILNKEHENTMQKSMKCLYKVIPQSVLNEIAKKQKINEKTHTSAKIYIIFILSVFTLGVLIALLSAFVKVLIQPKSE